MREDQKYWLTNKAVKGFEEHLSYTKNKTFNLVIN